MRIWALFLLIFGQTLSLSCGAQTAAESQTPPQSQTPVLRVDVRVMLVDAQVLNKKTRHAHVT